jgi:glyoxylase-like metal-dependent hydrolase (beta-lactamase superfamily II)
MSGPAARSRAATQIPPLRLVGSLEPARPAGGTDALRGVTVLERGWLSSNNVLIAGVPGEAATLVDSGHCLHAAQTVALVRAALGDERLGCVLNTHLHSDHCGGNAALQAAFGVPVFIPPGPWEAVMRWDSQALGYDDVAQRCERFTPQGSLRPGELLSLGGRHWHVIAAPGHDADAVMLFDPDHGVLISGDALWQDGFGVVFPELDGAPGFDDVAAVLDRIAGLPVRWVIPGHGAPFDDVDAALARARSRLAAFRQSPERHLKYGAKVLIKYHLLEEQQQTLAAFHLWAGGAGLLRRMWRRQGCPHASLHAWCDELLADLVRSGAAAVHQGMVLNA